MSSFPSADEFKESCQFLFCKNISAAARFIKSVYRYSTQVCSRTFFALFAEGTSEMDLFMVLNLDVLFRASDSMKVQIALRILYTMMYLHHLEAFC